MKTITAPYHLELIHLDFLTIGTKNDSNENVSVLLVTDHFTRYTVVYVMPKQTALIVAKDFESSVVKELCELAEEQKLRTTPYHPETNGQCECFNQMLINMIGTPPIHARKNWQEWVSTMVSAYNSAVSNDTGSSPYFLMYGHHPGLPIHIEFGVTQTDISESSHENYGQKLRARLKWAYKVAKETSSMKSERHK